MITSTTTTPSLYWDSLAVSPPRSTSFVTTGGQSGVCVRATEKLGYHTGLSTWKEAVQLTIATSTLDFSVSGCLIEQVCTLGLPPMSKFTSALVSISNVAGTALAIQAVASSTLDETAMAERKVTDDKITGPATGFVMGKFTLPRPPFS